MAPNGSHLGSWVLDTAADEYGPVGDLDGDGKAEIVVRNASGIGVLKVVDGAIGSVMTATNGTRFGQWLLNSGDNVFSLAADLDGDGRAELVVASPWGLGILKLAGGSFTAPMMAPNGTRFGQWLLNTGDNTFGPVADFDGDGRAEVLVTSPWCLGVLKLSGSTMAAPMMAPNGTRLGGWLLNTADNRIGRGGRGPGGPGERLLFTSPWGIGLLQMTGSTLSPLMMAQNGTRFGGWLLNRADNEF
jgi:hypothetical protein